MSRDFTESEINRSEKLVIRDERSQKVQTVIFPHTTQVGLPDKRYQSSLTVQGSLKVGELTETPERPVDGSGGIFYVKSDGKPYFRSYEQTEVDLTATGGGGGEGGGAVSSIANGADNRIATFSSANALNGEANLTFDGTTLTVAGTSDRVRPDAAGGSLILGETSGQHLAFDSNEIASKSNATTMGILGVQSDGGTFSIGASTEANVGIGTNTPGYRLHVISDTIGKGEVGVTQVNNSTATDGGNFRMLRARGTKSSPAVVQSGDALGVITFNGYDGTDYASEAGQIWCEVDGSPGENDMPGRMLFKTTPDGTAAPETRMSIKSDGKIGIGTESPAHSLDVVNVGASSVRIFANQDHVDARPDLIFEVPTPGSGKNRYSSIAWKEGSTYKWNLGLAMWDDSLTFSNSNMILGNASNTVIKLHSNNDIQLGQNAASKYMYHDHSNARWGIGTFQPSKTLSVMGDAGFQDVYGASFISGEAQATNGLITGFKAANSNSGANSAACVEWSLESITASKIIVGKEQLWSTNADTDAYMAFNLVESNSLSEKMRLTSTGRLGIGNTSPAANLHITNTSGGNLLRLDTGSDATNDPQIFITGQGEDTLEGFALNYDNSSGDIRYDVYYTGGDHVWRLKQDSDDGVGFEGMRLTSDGRLGVGDNNPANRLSVGHQGTDFDNGIMVVRNNASVSADDILGGIGFDSKDGSAPSSILEASAYIAAYASENHSNTDKGGYLSFGTAPDGQDDDTVSTERMRLTSAGKLGIGTTDPVYEVDVQASNARLRVKSAGSTALMFIDSATDHDAILYFREDGSNKWLIGHDATDDLFKFDNNNSFASPAMTISTAGVVTATTFAGNASSASAVGTASNSTDANQYIPFIPSNSGNQSLRTDAGLNYNPSSNKLNVGGDIDSGGDIESTGAITAGSNIKADGGYVWARQDAPGLVTNLFLDNLSDHASSASRILFRQGINEVGTVANAAAIQIDTDQQWTTTNSTKDASLSFYTSLDGSLTEKARVTSDGKLGIGTTSPVYVADIHASTANLRVKSAGSSAYMLIDAATDNDAILYFRENGSNKWLIGHDATDDLFKFDNSNGFASPAMTITNTGIVTATTFAGNASSATKVFTAANSTDANQYIPFIPSNSGNQSLRTDAGLNYNPSSNQLNVGGAIDAQGTIESTSQITAGSNIKANNGYLWARKDVDANTTVVYLDNMSDHADSASQILFRQGYTDAGSVRAAAAIQVGTEQQWSSISSTNDAFLSFHTALNNSVLEKARITSDGKLGIGTSSPSQLLHLQSADKAAIYIEADTDNTVGDETGTGFIRISQDGAAVNSYIGHCPANNDNPEGGVYTGTIANALLIGTTTQDHPVMIGEHNLCMARFQNGRMQVGDLDGSAPGAPLHVRGGNNGTTGVLRVYNTDSSMSSNQTTVAIVHNDDTTSNGNYFIQFFTDSTAVGGIDSEVVFEPFTGAHPTQISDDQLKVALPGMIVCSTGEVFYRSNGISNAWVKSRLSEKSEDKSVLGVYSQSQTRNLDTDNEENIDIVNAIGEGQILVTDENGNIEIGDYICTSNRLGHGMKQDSSVMMNYTVAKATEPIDFTNIEEDSDLKFKSVLVACTYHCG